LAINSALLYGGRGFSGGSSLSEFLISHGLKKVKKKTSLKSRLWSGLMLIWDSMRNCPPAGLGRLAGLMSIGKLYRKENPPDDALD
jgi:hypothetical protein